MRAGGIFSLGQLGAFGAENLMLTLSPAAGSQPAVKLLQSWMQAAGTPKLSADGVWGQCSHSAFTRVAGAPPSWDSLNQILHLDKLGVPRANVSVWKPSATDTCYGGSDAYEAPPIQNQVNMPDPGIMLANLFGLPVPADICGAGYVPNKTTQRCECAAGTYQNPQTGECVQVETPGKISPSAGALPKFAKMLKLLPSPQPGTPSSGGSTSVTLAPGLKLSAVPQSSAPASSTDIWKVLPLMSGLKFSAVQPAQTGMSAGAKFAIGVGVLALVGAAGYFALRRRRRTQAETFAANCFVRNCSY